jgi:predicted Zn-dependent protease
MRQAVAFVALLLVAGSALYFVQRRARRDSVSANALVDVAADWQHDITRAPMHFTRISDDEEMRIGNQLANRFVFDRSSLTPDEQALEAYVNDVGGDVAAHTRRRLAWKFHLLPQADLINAFALPGGHVFIGKGLIDQLTSEDELAFALGHEIEHIDHYHASERLQIDAQLRHLDLDVVADFAGFPMSLWQAGYSKDEEFEADREGLRIAVASGYSAQGAVKLLERWTTLRSECFVHAETPADELSQLAIDGLNGYFRSHPLPSERLAAVNETIAHDQLATDMPSGCRSDAHEFRSSVVARKRWPPDCTH